MSNNNSNTTSDTAPNIITSPSQTSYAFQQLLPLKLRESAKNPLSPVQGSSAEILSSSSQQGPSHSRTGSSPAMMQSAQVLRIYSQIIVLTVFTYCLTFYLNSLDNYACINNN